MNIEYCESKIVKSEKMEKEGSKMKSKTKNFRILAIVVALLVGAVMMSGCIGGCGGSNQDCCEGNKCNSDNFICKDNKCVRCGGIYEPCCEDDKCNEGLCSDEKCMVDYSTYTGDKSTFKYPDDWKNMNPSELGMSQIHGVKFIIKMQKDKHAFIIFESEETERVPIDEDQLNWYISEIKQGYGAGGGGQFSVLDRRIVNYDEAIVEFKAGNLHGRTGILNCDSDKINMLTFTSREDKWGRYEGVASHVIDSFKCI